jgi:hypothetical protein
MELVVKLSANVVRQLSLSFRTLTVTHEKYLINKDGSTLDDLTVKWEKLHIACLSGVVILVSSIMQHKVLSIYKITQVK